MTRLRHFAVNPFAKLIRIVHELDKEMIDPMRLRIYQLARWLPFLLLLLAVALLLVACPDYGGGSSGTGSGTGGSGY